MGNSVFMVAKPKTLAASMREGFGKGGSLAVTYFHT